MVKKISASAPKLTANDILLLLEARHSNDVFIPECKNGPSQFTSHRRLDAWAMKKSWTNPCAWGYEIKVARRDFLKDDKWRGYLAYCNEFSFVCPPKLIDPSELPDQVGLIWTSVNGARLFTKRKAAYRSVDIPETFYQYILMARTSVCDEHAPRSREQYWRDWLDEKRGKAALGYNVSRRIRKLIEERIDTVDSENSRLRNQNERLLSIKALCVELGIEHGSFYSVRSDLRRALEVHAGDGLLSRLDRLAKEIVATRQAIIKSMEPADLQLQAKINALRVEGD